MSEKMVEAIELTGRKEAMVPFGIRIPRPDAHAVRRLARTNRCTSADVIRTFVKEGLDNHKIMREG